MQKIVWRLSSWRVIEASFVFEVLSIVVQQNQSRVPVGFVVAHFVGRMEAYGGRVH